MDAGRICPAGQGIFAIGRITVAHHTDAVAIAVSIDIEFGCALGRVDLGAGHAARTVDDNHVINIRLGAIAHGGGFGVTVAGIVDLQVAFGATRVGRGAQDQPILTGNVSAGNNRVVSGIGRRVDDRAANGDGKGAGVDTGDWFQILVDYLHLGDKLLGGRRFAHLGRELGIGRKNVNAVGQVEAIVKVNRVVKGRHDQDQAIIGRAAVVNALLNGLPLA